MRSALLGRNEEELLTVEYDAALLSPVICDTTAGPAWRVEVLDVDSLTNAEAVLLEAIISSSSSTEIMKIVLTDISLRNGEWMLPFIQFEL